MQLSDFMHCFDEGTRVVDVCVTRVTNRTVECSVIFMRSDVEQTDELCLSLELYAVVMIITSCVSNRKLGAHVPKDLLT